MSRPNTCRTLTHKPVKTPVTDLSTHYVTEAFGDTLRRKYGELRGAAKRLARVAGSNEDAARNWLEARNTPNLATTIRLMREDDDIFDLVCRLADRDPGTPAINDAQRAALLSLLERR